MKRKIILGISLLAFSLILSACSSNNSQDFSDNVAGINKINGAVNENNILNESNNINTNKINKKNMRTLDGQQDLAKEYSKAIINTNQGNITVEFFNEDSPITVNNFLNLVSDGFYKQTKFHRVIKDFMIQGGDPNSKNDDTFSYGTGSPGYKFADEFNNHKLVAGSLAMANSGPNSNGSQFFIVTAESTPWLDGMHTNFGKVVAGMDVISKIENVETGERDIPVEPIIINSIELVK